MGLEQEIEKLIEGFLADFEKVDFEGYRHFFSPTLILIMPKVGVLRGLDAYLGYESTSTKRGGRSVTWDDRRIDVHEPVARAMGLLTMRFTIGDSQTEIREFVTFLFKRNADGRWQCFHLQATLAG